MQNFQRLNNSETLKLYEYFMNIILYYENIQYNILLNYQKIIKNKINI